MSKTVQLLHSAPVVFVPDILRDGIRATSAYDHLGLDMRRDVVFCWLRQEDDKMSSGDQRSDHVYLKVLVTEDRCVVAEMDLISIALMYQQGQGGVRVNPEAARLIAEAYRITAAPLSEYAPGMFCTPEVLVKGDITPECIQLPVGQEPIIGG